MIARFRNQWIGGVALALVVFGGAAADPARPVPPEMAVEKVRLVRAEAIEEGDSLVLALDRDAYARLQRLGSVVVEDFPLPGREPVSLSLRSFPLIAADARFVAVGPGGERTVARPRMSFFRGTVAGDLDSLVALSLFDGRIAGFVRAFGEEFSFGPLRYDSLDDAEPQIRIRNRAAEPQRPPGPICGVDGDLSPRPLDGFAAQGTPIDGDTLLVAGVAIDATVEWYEEFGSLPAAQNYILNKLAEVSAIYESEVNVQFEVPYLRVFTAEPDPYTNGESDSESLLYEMRTEWNDNQTGVERTVAHLFSASGSNGHAFLDTLCQNDISPGNSSDYGATLLNGNGASWERWLVAHELGHSFSSPHTHCYNPEIDQCANESGCYQGSTHQITGTIMSYCNSVDHLFHQRVEDERIRPAVEEAFPTCVEIAGDPGRLRADTGDGLAVEIPAACPQQELRNDDGVFNNVFGVAAASQGAFIKRFTPACHPFRLTRIEIITGASPSIEVGRPIRLLVYNDPGGSGDPAQSTLIYTEDTVIPALDYFVFNQYELATPVDVVSGDLYIGYYDLLSDPQQTTIAVSDNSTSGDSYRKLDSTTPEGYNLLTTGTWMIRGQGGPVSFDTLLLSWGASCNDGEVPGQDFAVYQGNIGDFSGHASLTCTTFQNSLYFVVEAPADTYYLVVPQTSNHEGSYGTTGAGAGPERPAAALPCKPQSIAACP